MTYDNFLGFLDKFEDIPSFPKKIEFSNNNLGKPLGIGSGRVVYDIDSTKVFKVAKNIKGIEQNNAEIDASSITFNGDIVAKVFEADEDGAWLVAEYGRKVDEKRIIELTGIPSLNILKIYLRNWHDENNGKKPSVVLSKEMNDFMRNNLWVSEISSFMADNDQTPYDMGKPSTFGEVMRNQEPKIVMVDYGFSNDVFANYYDKNRKKNRMYELYNFADGNDDILSDIGNVGMEAQHGMWALMPYSVSDGDGVVNMEENKINFIEGRSTYPDKPIKNMGYLTDMFHECVNNIHELMKKSKNKKQFYNNLLALQEYLISQNAYDRDPLPKLIDEKTDLGKFDVKKMYNRMDYVANLLFNIKISDVINFYYTDREIYDDIIKDKIEKYLSKNPDDATFYHSMLDHNNINEDGTALYSTDSDIGSTGFPAYAQGYYGGNTDTEDVDKHYVNERQLHWIPGSQAVSIKKKCRIGGNGDGTSTACNTGDIKNLKLSKIGENIILENVLHEISLDGLKSIATKGHIGWLLPDNTFIAVRNHIVYLNQRYKDIIDQNNENPDNDAYPDADLYRMAYDEGLVRIWMEQYDGGPELGIRGKDIDRIKDIVENVYYEFFANRQSRVYIDVFGSTRNSYKFYLPQDKEEFANFVFGSGSNNNGVITEDYENLQNLQRYRYYLGWLLPDDTFVPVEKHQDYLEKIFPYEGDANKDNWYEYQEYVKSLYKKGFDQGLIRIDVRTTNGLPHLAIQGVDQNRIKSILQDVYYGYYSKIESYVYVDISDGNPNYTTGHKYYKFNLPQDKEEFANFVFGSGSNNNGVINEKNIVVKENSSTFAPSNESSNQLNESSNMDAFVNALKQRPFMQAVIAAGGEPFAVGGITRDLALGKKNKDIDLVVRKIPMQQLIEILKGFGDAGLVGKSFGVVKFKDAEDGEDYDIALPREDFSTGDGHKDFEVVYNENLPIEKDLVRRDAKFNAMAVNILTGEFLDPFNGMDDIKNKKMSMITPESFREDPLRMFRFVQQAARFRLAIDPETMKAIQENSQRTSSISPDRILEELNKIVNKFGDKQYGVELLVETGLYQALFGKNIEPSTIERRDWEAVRDLGEYFFLMTYGVIPNPAEFFKVNMTGDNDGEAEIQALTHAFDADQQHPQMSNVEARSIAHNMYSVSPMSLESQILPQKIEVACKELLSGRYPKTTKELAVNGNDIMATGLKGKPVGDMQKSLLIRIYADQFKNDRETLLQAMKPI